MKINTTSYFKIQYNIDNIRVTKASVLLFNQFVMLYLIVSVWKYTLKRSLQEHHAYLQNWRIFSTQLFVKGRGGGGVHGKGLSLLTWHRDHSAAQQKLIHIRGSTSGCIRLGMSNAIYSAQRRSLRVWSDHSLKLEHVWLHFKASWKTLIAVTIQTKPGNKKPLKKR